MRRGYLIDLNTNLRQRMRFLHTSDWHLGQKLLFRDREEEHRRALDWLRGLIEEHRVETLIVAGDVFDIGNPPNYARRLYYSFLTGLLGTSCRHIVITGGNHDSPSMLDAPRALLQALHIHVIGAAGEVPEEQLIELHGENGELEAVVAAVPFLRDRDLRYSVAGEGGQERQERIREGIRHHYAALAKAAASYVAANVPILATGHLYARGAEASAKQDNIYIGNTENIDAADFPKLFQYVALGHLHRPQAVGGCEHIRYSGSLIPLSFSETKDEKGVCLVDFDKGRRRAIRFLEAPVFRRLKTIEGTLEEVKQSLRRFEDRGERLLPPWVEVIVHTDTLIPQLDTLLNEFTAGMDLELLKIRLQRSDYQGLDEQSRQEVDLQDMDALEVFRKKCESYGSPPEEMAALETTFRELQQWLTEKSD